MTNKKLIMFDFDGVIVDTLGVSYSIDVEVNESLTLGEYKKLYDGNVFDTWKKKGLLEHPNYHGIYNEKVRELKIPEEIKIMLKHFAEGNTLSIVSSTPSASIRAILSRENVEKYFDDILGSDVHLSKVAKIKMLLEKYAVRPEETIFITDTTGDIREARECGVSAIGVTWGFQERETLERAEPLVIADTILELQSSIEKFFAAQKRA